MLGRRRNPKAAAVSSLRRTGISGLRRRATSLAPSTIRSVVSLQWEMPHEAVTDPDVGRRPCHRMLEIRTTAAGRGCPKATGVSSGPTGWCPGAAGRRPTRRRSACCVIHGRAARGIGGSADRRCSTGPCGPVRRCTCGHSPGIVGCTGANASPSRGAASGRAARAEVSRHHHSRWNGPERDCVEYAGVKREQGRGSSQGSARETGRDFREDRTA